MKLVSFIILILSSQFSHSQDFANLRHVQTDSTRTDFYISSDHKKIRYKDTVIYTWYKSKKIMSTQGSSHGDILNGIYKKQYTSGQLAESGNFKLGLKVGRWQYWDKNGLLTAIEYYKKGQLHGRNYIYKDGEQLTNNRFKKGTLIIKKEKKIKEPKADKTLETDTKEEDDKPSFFKRMFSKDKKDKTAKLPKEKKVKKLKADKKKKKKTEEDDQ